MNFPHQKVLLSEKMPVFLYMSVSSCDSRMPLCAILEGNNIRSFVNIPIKGGHSGTNFLLE